MILSSKIQILVHFGKEIFFYSQQFLAGNRLNYVPTPQTDTWIKKKQQLRTRNHLVNEITPNDVTFNAS